MPTRQIVVLMITRLAEPISYTVIFPFINQMVEELGITDNSDKVGFYSGLVESVFAFVQFFTVYHWATLSDRIGRKPVILLGLSGVCISISLFGLAENFWTMIIFRSLAGALNGNVAVVKAAIGDITDETNSTEAFALFGLTWTIGGIIGNTLGGTLSHPYERFPGVFGNFDILRRHPYLLPCVTSGFITFLGIVFAQIYYEESLPTTESYQSSLSHRGGRSSLSLRLSPIGSGSKHRSTSSISQMSTVSDTDTLVGSPTASEYPKPLDSQDFPNSNLGREYKEEEEEDEHGLLDATTALLAKAPPTGVDVGKGSGGVDMRRDSVGEGNPWGFWELIRWRPVRVMCSTMFLNSFIGGAWASVSLLFFFDRSGGLSMAAPAIGTALAVNGFWTIACQLLVLNKLQRWLGLFTAYKLLTFGWIPIFLLLPRLRGLLEATETPLPKQDGDADWVVRYGSERGWWTSIGVNGMLSAVTVVGMSNSLLMVLVNYASPDRRALGAVNGISTAVGCMARVVGPSLASALFAISMDARVLGGNLWWIVLVILAAVNFFACLFVGDSLAPPRLETIEEEEEV